MDISLKKEDYKVLNTIKENFSEECVEADFSLPEYMPEILRIVKSVCHPKINACRIQGDRVSVDGVCDLRMIYTAEDGCIYSFSQTRPFTRYCENSAFANAVDVKAGVSVSYVNCRATSTKRGEIKAGIAINVTAFTVESEPVINLGDSKNIEEKCLCVKGMSLGCKKTRAFSMSDTINLSVPSAFLLSYSAGAICTDIRKINNKIMIKGDAVVSITYVNAMDKSLTERVKHILPINQILEFDGMEEHFTGDVALCVNAVDVIPKGESEGFCNNFDISLGIDATASMYEEKELLVITDAYAVGKSIDLKKETLSFYSAVARLNENYIFKDNINIQNQGVRGILDYWGEITSVSVKKQGVSLCVSGSLSLSVLVKDGNDSLVNVNKILDFTYEQGADFPCDSVYCDPDLVLSALDLSVKGDGTVDLRAEIKINGTVFDKISLECVTAIEESEFQPPKNTNAITVYFPEKEESLWGIARKYNTTVSAIARENDLQGDTTENLRVVFIPSA